MAVPPPVLLPLGPRRRTPSSRRRPSRFRRCPVARRPGRTWRCSAQRRVQRHGAATEPLALPPTPRWPLRATAAAWALARRLASSWRRTRRSSHKPPPRSRQCLVAGGLGRTWRSSARGRRRAATAPRGSPPTVRELWPAMAVAGARRLASRWRKMRRSSRRPRPRSRRCPVEEKLGRTWRSSAQRTPRRQPKVAVAPTLPGRPQLGLAVAWALARSYRRRAQNGQRSSRGWPGARAGSSHQSQASLTRAPSKWPSVRLIRQ
mmetsp:Transcript_38723/g.107685  ORF Transcript_38723/g.107685 Transcript_38723/m.107685 type:complete len:262 (+) Transcript_38723:1341-2126(+)